MTYTLDYPFRDWDTKEAFERISLFEKPEELNLSYQTIPGMNPGTEIEIKIYSPKTDRALPMIMNVHGGGFIAGSYENDNNRVTYLAMNIPAVVVSVNYRYLPKYNYKDGISDCYQVWNWMYDHEKELNGIKEMMGLYGTSAGGNICAALAFYIRDNGGPAIALNALNTPVLGLGPTLSAEQFRENGAILKGDGLAINVRQWAGGPDGSVPSYYAVPNVALDFSGLPPTLIIAAECDPLRDESMEYVRHLQKDAIPVEFYIAPRAPHGFNAVSCALSEWINHGTVMSFQREFGMTGIKE